MTLFFNSQNQPKPPKPQPPFKEPELKSLGDFITYCSTFDPTISTQSGRSIDNATLLYQLYRDRDEVIIHLFNDFSEINLATEYLDFVLFICDAPLYYEKPQEYSLQVVEDRFSGKPKLNTSWKKLKNSQVHSLKTYACLIGSLDKERFQRWIVVKTPGNNAKYADAPEDMTGYGNTLPEADLEFHKARIKNLTNSQAVINLFIDKKIPLTKQQMFDTCKKIDPLINPNTVTFAYHEFGFSYIESSNFKLSCRSKIHKFTLHICEGDITWQIVKTLEVKCPVDIEIEFFSDNYPVKLEFVGEGITLEEAFDMCDAEYQECINDDENLAQLISFKFNQEMQKEIEMMMNDGEDKAFLDEMIADYGDIM